MANGRIRGITIELNGDTSGLNDAIKQTQKALKETQSSLKDVNKLLKFDPGNTELLKQKQEYLNKAVKETEERLKSEKELLEKLKNSGDTAKTTEQQKALERQIADTENQLKSLTEQSKEFGSVAAQQFKAAGDKMKEVGTKITDVGKSMTASVTAPIVGAGTVAAKMASDYEENLNKVDVAFGKNADEVKAWSETATQQFGLSKNAALEATSLFGDMGTSMGLTSDDAADMATNLAGLAGDLSSFKNVDLDQAMTALNGVFTGETESLKGLGVVMTETNLKGFADDMGLVYDEMTQAEKVTLRYQYVMENTKNAQGDYARTADGTANSFRTLQAELSNLAVTFGQEILPAITPVIAKITEAVRAFANLDENTKQIIVTVAAVAAAVGPVLIVIGSVVTAISVVTGAIGSVITFIGGLVTAFSAAGGAAGIFATAMAVITGPVGIVIGVITALIAIGVALYKNWDVIKEKAAELAQNISTKWEEIKKAVSDAIENVKTTISNGIETAKSTIENTLDAIKKAFTDKFDAAKKIVTDAIDVIKKAFDFEWKLPELKLPHFKVEGEFSLNPPKVPSFGIDWYAKAMNNGMILDGATLFGYANGKFLGGGEAGPEAIVGVSSLMNMIKSAVGETINYGGVNVVVYGAPGQDVAELADIISDRINAQVKSRRAVFS